MTSALRKIEWGPVIITLIGVALVGFGIRAFHVRRHFTVWDAVNCALLLLAAAMFLLVTSYIFQRARLVVVLLMVFMGFVLVRGSPAFAVALGIALIGAVWGPAFKDWREARQSKESAAKT